MFRTCWLTTSFAAACLLTGAGLLSLWDDVGWSGRWAQRRWSMVETDRGNIRIGYAYQSETTARSLGHGVSLGWFGMLAHQSGQNNAGWRYHVVTVPVWLAVGFFLAPPALAFLRGPGKRRGRLKRNECIACGYSMAGNTTGRCSECGASAVAGSVGKKGSPTA